ncbi:hypothetical protein DFH29DRAFT_1004558 [Suillus ampliporus]|nr:hypothetical protein DFH29DRAFT_1004558 [Suillus ampliporus]
MFSRLSAAFCVLLGLTALVNAGIVPVARDLVARDADLDERSRVIGVGNYGTGALYYPDKAESEDA